MNAKFILLNPLVPAHLGLTSFEEVIEALAEFGVGYVRSVVLKPDGSQEEALYPLANTPEAMAQMVTACDLEGIMVESTGIYEQKTETSRHVVHIHNDNPEPGPAQEGSNE